MAFGTGRISEIIDHLEKVESKKIHEIGVEVKLRTVCHCLQISVNVFDEIITNYSPVFRTIKGHVFETYFDYLMKLNGVDVVEKGGDDAIDREVNGRSLQLKTPTESGSSGNFVQYKTHKTHGAKSEKESLSYYHTVEEFADYLVGLIGYDPLRIIIISKSEIPIHKKGAEYILSPFTVNWKSHPGLNEFQRLGFKGTLKIPVFTPNQFHLLPLCSGKLVLPSSYIMDTILNKNNFRIWDMSIRGFAREVVFHNYFKDLSVKLLPPTSVRAERGDKADHAVQIGKAYKFIQMKGVSTNNCQLSKRNPIIAVETQLTRGRVNDHPTQSRLYLRSDFDYLVIGVDPPIVELCHNSAGLQPRFDWEFYVVPVSKLACHHIYQNRLKSLQKFEYLDLQIYRLTPDTFKGAK
jgi:hypothetical protein